MFVNMDEFSAWFFGQKTITAKTKTLCPSTPQSKILKLTWWPGVTGESGGQSMALPAWVSWPFSSLNRNPFKWRKLGSEFLQIICEIL